MRKIWIMITALVLLSNASAMILVGADCPLSVYDNEIFTCKVTMYNDSDGETEVQYVAHFSKGKATVTNGEGSVLLDAYTRKELNFEVWATDTGTDLFMFEYGTPKITNLLGKAVAIFSAPVLIDLKEATVSAGKSNTIKTYVSGSGSFVTIEFELPPSVTGTKRIDVGDVDGSVPITLEFTPDPYAVGTKTVYAYITFVDERGEHTLRQKILLQITPSFQVLGFALFILGAGILGYLLLRRRGGKEG